MIVVILVMLGLCFGSFVNALVWRLHKQELAKSKEQRAKFSISRGRSMCVDCQHTLAWYDLLPVISWLSLAGKCRYCHKRISWQYPLVELSTTILFVLSYAFWPYNYLLSTNYLLLFILWLVFLVGFMALAVYDLRWMILPNRIVLPMQLLAVAYAVLAVIVLHKGFNGLFMAVLAVLCSAGLFYAIFQVSGGKWIGGGDVKLVVILGLVLGTPSQALMMIFVASLIGTFISVPLLLSGKFKRTSKLPFGPMLIIGTIIVYLFGTSLIDSYTRLMFAT